MRWLAFALLTFMGPALAQTPAPEIPFETVQDFFKYPAEMNLGEIAAVAVNSKGHVFLLSRSNAMGNVFGGRATQLLEFDEGGRFIREIGKACTVSHSDTGSASTRRITFGWSTKARTW